MARPFGFFNSTASLKPALAFSTATGTSTDHFSYFARTLNDHFLPPSFPFLSLRPDGPPRWIIILALLDRIFGADDLPVPSKYSRYRERSALLVRFLFVDGVSDAGRESSNSNAPARLSHSRGNKHIYIYINVHVLRRSHSHPSTKGDVPDTGLYDVTPERNLTSHLEPKKCANHRASPAVNDKL